MIIHLNGWPGVGKRTVAAVLADRPRAETFVMTNALCAGAVRVREAWRHVVGLAEVRAAPLVPVVLEADEAVLVARVQSPERHGHKVAGPKTLATMLRTDRLLKPDVPWRLDLDTTTLTPTAAAAAIEAHLSALAAGGPLAPADGRHLVLVAGP